MSFRPALCIALILCALFASLTFAASSPDGAFRDADPASVVADRWVQPERERIVELTPDQLWLLIGAAPAEGSPAALLHPAILNLPTPDGRFEVFEIWKSPVMAPELGAWFVAQGFPMETWKGRSISDPTALVRLDFGGPAGFHARVHAPGRSWQIDPAWKGNTAYYSVYADADYRNPSSEWSCGVEGLADPKRESGRTPVGELRTYRLACAATGEYTAFHGGTQALGQAAVVTAINRVNEVYERDLSIRMVLVPNNNLLIFTNGVTDPYSNNNGGAMLGENQSTVDAVIGNANYDMGHVVSTGGGGVAGLGVVCLDGNKARGVTGLFSPIGDPFYIDYVAHEMGHQWGGNHTFDGVNGACSGGNRNDSTAYEPGSGTTIQAYAGICGSDNTQNNSDDFFHGVSLDEMLLHSETQTCDVTVSSGNTAAPVVDAGGDFVIPASTPFELTATLGFDADFDSMTFAWEQWDRSVGGVGDALGSGDQGDNPIFRAWDPSPGLTRVFPRLSDLLANTTSAGEVLPSTDRTLTFRCNVRDNNAGGGLFGFDTMSMTVSTSAGPFLMTSPNGAENLSGVTTVTWVVAGTASAPVSASLVDIWLSTDGGLSWPTQLASNRPNDGAEDVLLPAISTSQARIKVKGDQNVFFDISNGNFSITPGCTPAAAPTGVTAADLGSNQIQVSWADNGSLSFAVYRADGSCPGSDFVEVASLSAATTSWIDTSVSGGSTYAYYVTGTDACFESDPSTCQDATATGACLIEPTFAGIESATNPGDGTCGIALGWSLGASGCGANITYSVHRDTAPGFLPDPTTLITDGLVATSFVDVDNLIDGVTYYYVVLAVDSANALTDGEGVEASAAPTGQRIHWTDNVESYVDINAAIAAGWSHAADSGVDDWRVSTVAANSGSRSFAADDFDSINDKWLIIPTTDVTANSELVFWHQYDFETDWDGGVIEIFDGSWTDLGPAITQNGYDGTITVNPDSPISGRAAWSGLQATFEEVRVDLSAWVGSGRQVRFRLGSDGFVGAGTWYIDDVQITDIATAQPCTTSLDGSFFSDGFESGDSASWAQTVP